MLFHRPFHVHGGAEEHELEGACAKYSFAAFGSQFPGSYIPEVLPVNNRRFRSSPCHPRPGHLCISCFGNASSDSRPSVRPRLGSHSCESSELIRGSLIRTRPEDLPTSIWDPASAFTLILERLDAIYQNLPEKYHLTDENILDVKKKNILGGVFFLHFLIHAVAFDLTRISLPGFFFPLASAFQSAEPWFLSYCRDRCRFHAVQATNLIRRGLSHGRVPFDDIFAADAALEAAKIQIIYTATVNQSLDVIEETRGNVDMTLRFFQQFNFGQAGPSQYVRDQV
jgi:hypothetical protein